MKIDIVDCFCTNLRYSGNRAAVITDFEHEEINKQEIAKTLNLPVTVFIHDLNTDKPLLEYFYPETEMPLCLHGTIAAGQIVLERKGENYCQFITSKSLRLDVSKNNTIIQVKVGLLPSPVVSVDCSMICRMLNLREASSLNTLYPITVASVGSPKLLVSIKSKEDLLALSPNFELIKEWSINHKVNGLYVFSPPSSSDDACDFIARAFNPKTGHNEDAATAVASAALTTCMKRDLIVRQGDNLGHPCRIINEYVADNTILIGGEVRFIPKNENVFQLQKTIQFGF